MMTRLRADLLPTRCMMPRMTAKEFREQPAPKRNKYGAKKTTIDGIEFASKAEAAYYSHLKLRERAGEVYEVELQPRFSLVVNGVLITNYRADFRFYDAVEKCNRVIDVKGFKVRDLQMKLNLMRALFKINVELVK